MTNIQSQIGADIKSAMLAKDTNALNALRVLNNEIQKVQKSKEFVTKDFTDADVSKVISNEVLKRKETIKTYTSQNRQDLVDEEQAQLNVIEKYIPKMLSGEELLEEVKNVIAGQTSFQNAIKIASSHFRGKADGKEVAQIVKSLFQ